MKARVKRIINEAKVQRTIDSKIWASMSSMSSRLRSTLALDAKPMKRDTKEVLLLKYVAGLLTMKVNCPNNVNDISKNKAYQNFGNAFIEAGGTILEIQKLYQENGGTLTTSFNDSSSEQNTESNYDFDDSINQYKNSEPEQDFPEYNDVDDEPNTEPEPEQDFPEYDNVDDEPNTEPEQDFPEYDDVDVEPNSESESETESEQDFPEYDDVDDEPKIRKDFFEKIEDKYDIKLYLDSLSRLFKNTKKGSYIIWDLYNGFILDNFEENNSIAQCVGIANNFIDKKPRFILSISNEDVLLNNAGNNNVYDDYYYKVKHQVGRNRIQITPGSNYYPLEEKKGEFYTDILINNDNEPAKYTKSINNFNLTSLNDISNKQRSEILNYFKEHAYLPTLPELSKCIEFLEPGKYWTSSVDNNGTQNIILQVEPDKVILTDNPNAKAKVVTFIKF